MKKPLFMVAVCALIGGITGGALAIVEKLSAQTFDCRPLSRPTFRVENVELWAGPVVVAYLRPSEVPDTSTGSLLQATLAPSEAGVIKPGDVVRLCVDRKAAK